jgi:hypothetical protein
MSAHGSSPRRSARTLTATLALLALAALGATAAGPAQAKLIGACEGLCPEPAPKPKLVTVYRSTYAYSTPYFNARHRQLLRPTTYIATCETKSPSVGPYHNPWWTRLRWGVWVNNGYLRGATKMNIGDCPLPRNDGGPPPPTCVNGAYQKKYLGFRRRIGVDHSIMRLTWQPELCRGTGGLYRAKENPTLETIGPGHLGVGLDLRAAERTPSGVRYRGDIRECTGVSAGYKGISFSGGFCRTVGRAQITASAIGRRAVVIYQAWGLKRAGIGYGRWVWTNRPV